MMHLYRFDTGETDHIAARTEDEARAAFVATYEDDMSPAVTEVPVTRWGMRIRDDDALGGWTTAAEIIGDPEQERDAFLVSSTAY